VIATFTNHMRGLLAAGLDTQSVGLQNSISEKRWMWPGMILVVGMLALPMYFFPSGGYQVADIPLGIMVLIALWQGSERRLFSRRFLWSIPFLAWVLSVNSFHYVSRGDIWNIKGTAVLIYGPLLSFSFAVMFLVLLKKGGLRYAYYGLVASVLGCFVAKGYSDSGRAALSFNDPNQLGYFAAILEACVLILRSSRETLGKRSVWYELVEYGVILMAHVFLALSLSRSAMAAFLFLDACLLSSVLKSPRGVIGFGVAAAFAVSYVVWLNPDFIEKRLAARPEHFKKNGILHNLVLRITKPLEFMTDWEIVTGTGAGIQFQTEMGAFGVKREDIMEVHNMIVDVFRSYGIIGVFLFLPWILKMIWDARRVKGAVWVWAAILVYNMGNNGIRFRALWILIGLILAVAEMQRRSAPPVEGSTGALAW
jgi:hypothetical protein